MQKILLKFSQYRNEIIQSAMQKRTYLAAYNI